MRTALLAALVLLAAQSGWAGVQYEFVQNTQSDIEQIPPTHLTGRAVIDGDRSRVDFAGGNIYAAGAYVISTNGSRTMAFVDPLTKSYSEINAAAIAAAYGASNVTISDLKTNLQKLGDQLTVAGVPTSHYHLTLTYEVKLSYGSMPLQQSVREEIDAWTTTQFGEIADNFFAGGTIRTGNPELDKIIEAETTLIKGFPLRQKTTITTSNSRGAVPGSKLPFSAVRTQQRDLQIQWIKPLSADASLFKVPLAYQKVEASQQANLSKQQPQVTMLTFETQQ